MYSFIPFLQAYFNMAESLTPTKAGQSITRHPAQVSSMQETVLEEFLRFYKKPLQVEVDAGAFRLTRRRSTVRSGSINRSEWTRLREVLWPTHLRSPLP